MSDSILQKLRVFDNLRIDMFRLRSINVGRMEVVSKLIQYRGEENIDLEEVADSMLVISIALLHEALCSYRLLVDLDSDLSEDRVEAYLNQIEEKEHFFCLSRKIRNMIFHVASETMDKVLLEWKALTGIENQDFVTKLHDLLWDYTESIFSGRRNIFEPFQHDELLEAYEEALRYNKDSTARTPTCQSTFTKN